MRAATSGRLFRPTRRPPRIPSPEGLRAASSRQARGQAAAAERSPGQRWPGRAHRGRGVVILAAALLLGGCTSGVSGTGTPAVAAVDVPGGRLALTDGLVVEVPFGAVRGRGRLQAQRVGEVPPAPRGLVSVGSAYEISVRGTELRGEFSVAVPAPDDAGPEPTVPGAVVLGALDATGAGWEQLSSAYDERTGLVTATVDTDRLTVATFAVPSRLLTQVFEAQFAAVMGPSNRAVQPTCTGSDELDANDIAVTADGADPVPWCAGVSDGTAYVELANDAGRPLALQRPQDWNPAVTGSADPVAAAAVDLVGPEQPLGDTSVHVLPPGARLALVAPAGAADVVTTRPWGGADVAAGLQFGAQVLNAVLLSAAWLPAPLAAATLAGRLGWVFASGACAADLAPLAEQPADTGAAAQRFTGAAGLAVACLGTAVSAEQPGSVGALLRALTPALSPEIIAYLDTETDTVADLLTTADFTLDLRQG